MNKIDLNIVEFLFESNLIESEPSGLALYDSIVAWNVINNPDIKKLKIADLISIHGVLMMHLNNRIAGHIRTVGVQVGGRVCPNPASVLYKLDDLLLRQPKTWEEIKQWHVDFEEIHPFEDGNGRTGRIIMNWQRIKNNLPILVIHHGLEQSDYYDWFN